MKPNVGKLFRTKKPPVNEWTAVEISQTKKGSKYFFSLMMKGETLWSVENRNPRQFSDVHVFASSEWYVAQAGSIRGLQIENMMPGETISCQIDMFCSVLKPQWSEWGACTKIIASYYYKTLQ